MSTKIKDMSNYNESIECQVDDMNTDKAIVDNLLHEYDSLWNYYNKLLEERHTIFHNFILIIGVPMTAVGFIVGIIGSQNVEDYYQLFNLYKPILGFVLYSLSLIGFLFYLQYIFESINATNYYQRIVKVKMLIAQLTAKFYCNDGFADKIYDAYGIGSADKRSSVFDLTRFIKIMILPTINSAILIGALLLSNCMLVFASIIGVVFFLLQILTFVIIGITKKRG